MAKSMQQDLLCGSDKPWEFMYDVLSSPSNLDFLFISAMNLL